MKKRLTLILAVILLLSALPFGGAAAQDGGSTPRPVIDWQGAQVSAPNPVEGGWTVSANINGNDQGIYFINQGATQMWRVVDEEGVDEMWPSVSQEGLLAYIRKPAGLENLGKDSELIVNGESVWEASWISDPTWSPDGASIAFVVPGESGGGNDFDLVVCHVASDLGCEHFDLGWFYTPDLLWMNQGLFVGENGGEGYYALYHFDGELTEVSKSQGGWSSIYDLIPLGNALGAYVALDAYQRQHQNVDYHFAVVIVGSDSSGIDLSRRDEVGLQLAIPQHREWGRGVFSNFVDGVFVYEDFVPAPPHYELMVEQSGREPYCLTCDLVFEW